MLISLNLKRTLVISLSYFFLFWVSLSALPSVLNTVSHYEHASITYLPHGVRVIAAWLYGWKSILYLAPGSYAAHLSWSGKSFNDLSAIDVTSPIFGIICVALTFELVARLGPELRMSSGQLPSWRAVLLVGAAGSIINALGFNLIVQNPIEMISAYFVGDVSGMILLFLTLMMMFRGLRRVGY